MLKKIKKINEGLRKKFTNGNSPFEIITRLAEEVGELAKEVNHFESSGIKREKYGEPDKKKLAKEIQDVIRSALQICYYYKVEEELKTSVEESYKKLKEQGFID